MLVDIGAQELGLLVLPSRELQAPESFSAVFGQLDNGLWHFFRGIAGDTFGKRAHSMGAACRAAERRSTRVAQKVMRKHEVVSLSRRDPRHWPAWVSSWYDRWWHACRGLRTAPRPIVVVLCAAWPVDQVHRRVGSLACQLFGILRVLTRQVCIADGLSTSRGHTVFFPCQFFVFRAKCAVGRGASPMNLRRRKAYAQHLSTS